MRKLGFLLVCFFQFSCSSDAQKKINGVSFVASREEATQSHVDEILNIHANSAAIMPFGFIREISSPEIIFDTDR
ncbi:MAG: glycoside hydrolase, partial [Maribacter sp.]